MPYFAVSHGFVHGPHFFCADKDFLNIFVVQDLNFYHNFFLCFCAKKKGTRKRSLCFLNCGKPIAAIKQRREFFDRDD